MIDTLSRVVSQISCHTQQKEWSLFCYRLIILLVAKLFGMAVCSRMARLLMHSGDVILFIIAALTYVTPGAQGIVFCFWCLLQHIISKVSQLITAKLCHMITNGRNFKNQIPKFGGALPLNFGGLKRPKLDNFRIWSRVSLEGNTVSTIRKWCCKLQTLSCTMA